MQPTFVPRSIGLLAVMQRTLARFAEIKEGHLQDQTRWAPVQPGFGTER